MTTSSLTAEFTLSRRHHSNRIGPIRWIASHALHHWYLGLIVILGAISNGALAGFLPVYLGQAFNDILANPPQTNQLSRITLLILGTQLLRAVLQWGRNFAAGLTSQRVERDIRDELYLSLLGKSMT